MDSIFNDQGALPGVISAAVKQLLDNAKALGLTWALRLATIAAASETGLTGVMDGDITPIGLINASGQPMVEDIRVYVLIIPPSGNFVIGYADTVLLGANCNTIQSMTPGTTASATFVSQPGSPNVIVTKRFVATSLRISWAQTYYVTGGDINALFGVVTGAGDQAFLAKNFVATTAGVRTTISGVTSLTGVSVGTQAWVGTWAQAGGGSGTLTVDSGCYWSMCIEEFWPSD